MYTVWSTFIGGQFVERVTVERTIANPDCATHVVKCMHGIAYVAHTGERMHCELNSGTCPVERMQWGAHVARHVVERAHWNANLGTPMAERTQWSTKS